MPHTGRVEHFGDDRSIGRGNLHYVTINLPRIALEIETANPALNTSKKLALFKDNWNAMAAVVKDILLDRYHRLLALTPDDFPCNQGFRLWLDDLRPGQSIEALFRNGTMSFGFIGLSEAVEILTGRKYYATQLGRKWRSVWCVTCGTWSTDIRLTWV